MDQTIPLFSNPKISMQPFFWLIAKNVNVKRGLAIRHRDLANLTGENAERMVNRKGNGKKGKCCLHKLLNNWAMYVCLALIHSIGFPTDSSWKITPMICQKKIKINSNCNTLTSSVSAARGRGFIPHINSRLACPEEIPHLVANRTANLPNWRACALLLCGPKQLDKLNLQILRYFPLTDSTT